MTFRVADRVQETLSVTGTGNITLGTASAGYLAFSATPNLASGDVVPYTILDTTANAYEGGYGTLTSSSGTWTLARGNIDFSSNSGALVSFAGNGCLIWLDATAKMIRLGSVSPLRIPLVAGRYYPSGPANANSASSIYSAAVGFQPLIIPNPITVTALAVSATSTISNTSTMYLGIYSDNGSQPGTLIAQTSAITLTAAGAAGIYSGTVSQFLAPGLYWAAYSANNGNNVTTYAGSVSSSGAFGFNVAAGLTGSTSFANAANMQGNGYKSTDTGGAALPSTPTSVTIWDMSGRQPLIFFAT